MGRKIPEESGMNAVALLFSAKKHHPQFMDRLTKIRGMILKPVDPVSDLDTEMKTLLRKYRLIFALNALPVLYKERIFALFEEEWGKQARGVYRKRLSQIVKETRDNKYGLSTEESMAILESLERAYLRLSGRENLFRRRPCPNGKIKIPKKLNEIKEIKERIRKQTDDALFIIRAFLRIRTGRNEPL
jgi:hypothetical protein